VTVIIPPIIGAAIRRMTVRRSVIGSQSSTRGVVHRSGNECSGRRGRIGGE